MPGYTCDSEHQTASNGTSQRVLRPVHAGLLLAIFFLGTALRLYGLDADSLWTDEIFTAERALLDLKDLISLLGSGEGRGVQLPLIYVLSHFCVASFGTSEFILRLPSMLAGSLSVLLIYKLGRIFWPRDVGLAAAFLLAVNPYHVQYSQEARHYAVMVFLALTSLILLVRAIQSNRLSLWAGFVISTSLNLYNHYFAFLFLPVELALAVWLVAENWYARHGTGERDYLGHLPDGPTPRRQVLALSLSMVLLGMSLLPWAEPLSSVISSPAGSGQMGLSAESVQSSWRFLGKVMISFSGVPSLALGVSLAAFFLGCARSTAKALALVILGIGAPFVFLTLMDPEHALIPKYVLFSLPLYLLAVARGLDASADLLCRCLNSRMRERKLSQGVALTLAVLLMGTLSMAPLKEYYRWDKEDWRSAAAYLHENMAQDDILIVDGQRYGEGGDSQRVLEGLPYYLSLHDRDVAILPAKSGLADTAHREALPGAGVWGVLWHVDPLRDTIHLGSEIEIVELPSVAVIRRSSSAGNTLEDAACILDAMAQLQPRPIGRFDLRLALAELYHDLGRTDQAEGEAGLAGAAAEEHERQAALDPRLQSRAWGWRPYWNLGTTYDELGMLHDAKEAYIRVLSINSTHLPSHLRLGSVYRQLGEPGEALSVYQQAVELETETAQLYRLLGETYQGLGLVEEAVLAYEEVLRIEPDDEWSKRKIHVLSTSPFEEVPHPLLRSLGTEVALLGYDLYPSGTEAGGTLDVALWFRALANMDRDYTVFVRLTGPDNHLWAQEDKLLLLSQIPTSEWGLGVVARNDYHLHVPHNAPPGQYAIVVGVYYWETEERLPMWDEHGHREPNDAVVLSHTEVTPALPGD